MITKFLITFLYLSAHYRTSNIFIKQSFRHKEFIKVLFLMQKNTHQNNLRRFVVLLEPSLFSTPSH